MASDFGLLAVKHDAPSIFIDDKLGGAIGLWQGRVGLGGELWVFRSNRAPRWEGQGRRRSYARIAFKGEYSIVKFNKGLNKR